MVVGRVECWVGELFGGLASLLDFVCAVCPGLWQLGQIRPDFFGRISSSRASYYSPHS